jgi:PKD repeat protein
MKSSPLDSISFPEGAGTPVIEDSDSPFVTNVNATKQTVNSTTGMALLAVNRDTDRYWHNFLPILPAMPVADFTATPTSGTAPLSVAFEDDSGGGAATSWTWDFGDGSTSTDRNPTHTYTAPGTYTVSLTATNARGSDSETKTGHIVVGSRRPDFSLGASPAIRNVFRFDITSFEIALTPRNGFSGPVTLSVKGLPRGTYASFSPSRLNVPRTTRSRMIVKVAWWARLGTYPLVVTGTDGTHSRSTTVTLRIRSRFERFFR